MRSSVAHTSTVVSSAVASRSQRQIRSREHLLAAAVLAGVAASLPAQFQFAPVGGSLPPGVDSTRAVAFGDVDGDGDLDLVAGNGGGNGAQNRLYRNDGTGAFTDETTTNMPVASEHTQSIAFGDVDGDGDVDIVCGNEYGQNRLYLNNGSGVFADATATQLPTDSDRTTSVVLGDVDGDGDLDLVCGTRPKDYGPVQYTYYLEGQNRLYLNDGSGSFTDVTASQMPMDNDRTQSAVFADVDGDGDLDVISGNHPLDLGFTGGGPVCTYGGQNRLYLNNGTGVFQDVATRMPSATNFTNCVALGDVDGDGDLDMVCANGSDWSCAGDQNRLYLNDGGGIFTDATMQLPVDSQWTKSVALGDIDDDGDIDLVIGNGYVPGGGQNFLYLNDGAGTFLDATATRMSTDNTVTNAVTLGDVDADGDLDIACGNGGWVSAENRIDRNLQRQLDAPTSPQIGQPYSLDAYLRYGPTSTIDLAAIYLSTAPASIASPFGTLGIDPALAVPFPTLVIPQPAGIGSVGFTIPNVPGLIGQVIYSQAMLVAYPANLRLSNVVRDVIAP